MARRSSDGRIEYWVAFMALCRSSASWGSGRNSAVARERFFCLTGVWEVVRVPLDFRGTTTTTTHTAREYPLPDPPTEKARTLASARAFSRPPGCARVSDPPNCFWNCSLRPARWMCGQAAFCRLLRGSAGSRASGANENVAGGRQSAQAFCFCLQALSVRMRGCFHGRHVETRIVDGVWA